MHANWSRRAAVNPGNIQWHSLSPTGIAQAVNKVRGSILSLSQKL